MLRIACPREQSGPSQDRGDLLHQKSDLWPCVRPCFGPAELIVEKQAKPVGQKIFHLRERKVRHVAAKKLIPPSPTR